MNWHFDWNEMIMFGSSLIALFVILMLRKYFHKIVFIIIWIYSIVFVESTDYFLAASPFRVYYCGDNVTYEPSAAAIHLFLYPVFSFIFLLLYNRLNISGIKLILYILAWDIFSTFFEWLYLINGAFTYTGWKVHYSFFVYPLSSLLLIKIYKFTISQLNKPIPT
ncbi:hypothetical protein J1P26_01830 [Neobacillus sp. MM2021_6]|uniref:hypothetical protein n=1 Tax=Bacillaceae TaxID=186817 RepID=UPI0014093B74|nr:MULTISPECIES: hypothetical protein [Bacillaceae]MBO0958454.1 hypothetical protein [Neobacillus sp. MM2021_6]NHC20729.1 hypothetical protein [Bacillus sp. MM2020_4]